MARVDINDVPIDYVLLTPSDTTNLSKVAFQGDNYPQRALYIELAGDICVTTLTTEKRTIPVPQGLFLLRISRLWDTGTTAEGIYAVY